MEKKYIYPRIFAYIFTIFIHLYSINNCFINFKKLSPLPPELMKRHKLSLRYLTVWNIIFQIIYALVGLTCDFCTLMKREKFVPQTITKFRYIFFSAIVFPNSLTVSAFFWSIFLYDRELIFPKVTAPLLSWFDNHVAHTLIVPIVLWELTFQPKICVSHKNNLIYIFILYIIYNSILFYTRYGDLGYWAYEILTAGEGTAYFYLFFACEFFLLYIFYSLQWYIKDFIGFNKTEHGGIKGKV